ncbi:MAG: hypothetical protein KDK07_20015 [Bauldia sp.]|nr:hypothetical protein [Bauldia sp.]
MPFYVVHALDRQGSDDVRAANRPAHRLRLREHDHPVSVRVGGPLLDDRGQMCGTLLIVEAGTEQEVAEFLAADPYVVAGLYEDVSIRGFNWGLGRPGESDG